MTRTPRTRTSLTSLLVGLAAASAVTGAGAVGVGALTYDRLRRNDHPDEMWAELGNAMGALAAGALTAVVVHAIGVVVVIRRAVEPGRRFATGVVALLAPVAVCVGAVSAARSGSTAGLPFLVLPVQVAIVAAVAAAIAVVAGAAAPRRARAIMGAAGAGTLLLSLLLTWRGEQVADSRLAARYEESGAPLALVDGTGLAVPVEGWELVDVAGGWSDGSERVRYDAPVAGEPGETAWMALTMEVRPDMVPCRAENGVETCLRLGRRDDGAVIRGRRVIAGARPFGVVEAWVDVDGGRWTIDGSSATRGSTSTPR